MAAVCQGGVATFFDTLWPKLLARPEDGLERPLKDMAYSQSAEGVVSALKAMRDRPDQTRVLAELQVPLLVMVGERDVITPPEEAWRMAQHAPGAKVVVIPAAGHLSNLEQPAAFNAALASWLKRS
jgi:pimeloyl-ACP methyl ester carboxylesterase